MAWYYYRGKTPRSILVKEKLSVVVKPHGKIEILTVTRDVKALIRSGMLRRTGKPAGATSVASVPVPQVKLEDVLPKSAMAKATAEKGVTGKSGVAPKKPGGNNPEFTAAETAGDDGDKADVLTDDDPVETPDAPEVEEGSKGNQGKKKKRNKGKGSSGGQSGK